MSAATYPTAWAVEAGQARGRRNRYHVSRQLSATETQHVLEGHCDEPAVYHRRADAQELAGLLNRRAARQSQKAPA
jgi:hypothetical protein